MSPEPTEEARQLAREWLDEPHGLVWYADEYEDVVVAVARLLDLVVVSVASEKPRCATCRHWRSEDGATGSCGVMAECGAGFYCALHLAAERT